MSASPDAERRIANALRHIQDAQTLLGRALSELGTLRHIGPEYARACKLYDAVHAHWYRVKAIPDKRVRVTTDSEAVP